MSATPSELSIFPSVGVKFSLLSSSIHKKHSNTTGQPESDKGPQWTDFKKICRAFNSTHDCHKPKGMKCKFLHQPLPDMLKPSDLSSKLEKSKLCFFHKQGCCKLSGKNCKFAHSEDEMKQHARPDFKKNRLCLAFMRNDGYCNQGDNCKYAHEQGQLVALGNNDINKVSNSSDDKDKISQERKHDHEVPVLLVQKAAAEKQSQTTTSLNVPVLQVPIDVIECPDSLPRTPRPEDDDKYYGSWADQITMATRREVSYSSANTNNDSTPSSRSLSKEESTSGNFEDSAANQKGEDQDPESSTCIIGLIPTHTVDDMMIMIPNPLVTTVPVSDEKNHATEVPIESQTDVSSTANGNVHDDKIIKSDTNIISKNLKPELRKTKFCKFFIKGECTRGTECHFAHDILDMKNRPDLRKTSLCLSYMRNLGGSCRLGDKCQYAHGQEELRKKPEDNDVDERQNKDQMMEVDSESESENIKGDINKMDESVESMEVEQDQDASDSTIAENELDMNRTRSGSLSLLSTAASSSSQRWKSEFTRQESFMSNSSVMSDDDLSLCTSTTEIDNLFLQTLSLKVSEALSELNQSDINSPSSSSPGSIIAPVPLLQQNVQNQPHVVTVCVPAGVKILIQIVPVECDSNCVISTPVSGTPGTSSTILPGFSDTMSMSNLTSSRCSTPGPSNLLTCSQIILPPGNFSNTTSNSTYYSNSMLEASDSVSPPPPPYSPSLEPSTPPIPY